MSKEIVCESDYCMIRYEEPEICLTMCPNFIKVVESACESCKHHPLCKNDEADTDNGFCGNYERKE